MEKRKKGRPSKADLARRAAAVAEDGDVIRISRSRNAISGLDFEEERRGKKKLKVLLGESAPSQTRCVDSDVEAEIEEEEESEVRERKAGSNDAVSVPGTPSGHPMEVPLPDKNTLELILNKLQKKDTYGVFAEPVDLDELPDYHDVIEHPMDFATLRTKLGKGSYSTLEQFESDVLLICSNAMQYNAPDTIYHKQAFSIQELAKRKFQRLRSGSEQYENELQSEQKPTSNSLGNDKKIKKSISRIAPETVASDLSSGATLATFDEDLQTGSTTNASVCERLSNVDKSVDGTASPSDNNLDKAEDIPSGTIRRGHNPKFGRKPLIHDKLRRATYNITTQPVCRPESGFSTFDGEIKQLVAVGLHVDHSYARSLARFAARLGPAAWDAASKRIEQALPPGLQFSRGWVGDYEPISTPVLFMQKCSQTETVFGQELNFTSNRKKDDKIFNTPNSFPKNPLVSSTTSEEKSTFFDAPVNTTVSPSTTYSLPSKAQPFREEIPEVKPNITANVSSHIQSPRMKNIHPEKKVKGVKLNSPPSSANQSSHEFSTAKYIPNGTSIRDSKPVETLAREMNPSISVPLQQPPNNGFVEKTNEKLPRNCLNINRTATLVNDRKHTSMPVNYFPHGYEQGLPDTVQLMRRLTKNTQKPQKSISHSTSDYPLVPQSRKDDTSNASSAAARAWVSIEAGSSKSVSENTNVNHRNQIFADSLHNPTQESRFRNDFPVSGIQFHHMNNFPVQGFMAPKFCKGNEAQFQNQPPMVFPQMATTDLSQFQMQAFSCQRQKQETTIPPDLNLVFHSSGSPGSQSSGVQVDPQQPDLALQL